ncbi:ABC transporter permease subunit [Indiicoccus explosivorum]|uniref:ABC transporter permease subunit n=1 Tax=Indiicoccus explosivorum TaxID=1917864 RepID=UPI000B452143|nr:ABC transporter permease subunit [Indiicoccus explosivorum]
MTIIQQLFRKKLFLAGFTAVTLLFLSSMGYYLFFGDHIPHVPLQFENGDPLPPPYDGTVFPPLGSDTFGRNVAFVLFTGAKYTILAGIVIAFVRVVPAVFVAIGLHYFVPFLQKPLKNAADAINYFPMTLFAFLLLYWIRPTAVMDTSTGVLTRNPGPDMWPAVFIYIAVLSVVFIPANAVLIANEMKRIYKKEFIASSITLGAGKWRILTRHMKPFIVPQVFLVGMREFIQTLLLMAHLGVLAIFIGGVTSKQDLFGIGREISVSNEWSGLLGMWWDYLYTTYPWLSALPIIMLTLLIFAVKCMVVSLEAVLAEEAVTRDAMESDEKEDEPAGQLADSRPPFQLLPAKPAESRKHY